MSNQSTTIQARIVNPNPTIMTKRRSKPRSSYRPIAFAVAWFFAATTADADGLQLPEPLQIHGFLSQSVLRTTQNNFFGNSKDSFSPEFRELGINASWQPTPSFRTALQLVSRDAGRTDDSNIRVDFALVDYTLHATETNLLGIRAGRVPTPLGLYNDTRDVPSLRPSIWLPQSIYFDANRNFSLSADTAYIYNERRTDFGDFLLQIGGGFPRTDDPDLKQVIVDDFPGEMEGEPSWVSRIGYEWGGGALRLLAFYGDINSDFRPDNIPGNLQAGSFRFNPLILSFQYNGEKLSLTSEYAWRRTRVTNFGFPNADFTGNSYYVQGTYRLWPSVEALVRYDQLIWNNSDRDGKQFEAAGLGPSCSRFAKDWTFGLGWYITPALLLRAEYHRVNGTGWLSTLENPQGTHQNWNLYAVQLSYTF